jgi:hypothetical protein
MNILQRKLSKNEKSLKLSDEKAQQLIEAIEKRIELIDTKPSLIFGRA